MFTEQSTNADSVRREAYEIVWRLDASCKFVVERRGVDHFDHTWDGSTLVVRGGASLLSDLHDISHFVVAPTERRFLAEFGLGGDPNRYQSKPPCVIGAREADYEEELTCYLQLGLGLAFGIPLWKVKNEGLSINTPVPDDTHIYMVQQYTPDGLSPGMWKRVYAAVRSATL